MAIQNLKANFQELQSADDVPTLERRLLLELKLGHLFKIVPHNLRFFLKVLFTHRTNSPSHFKNTLSLVQPYTHTNSYFMFLCATHCIMLELSSTKTCQ